MSTLADRLRGIVASVPKDRTHAPRPVIADEDGPRGDADAAEVLGGCWHTSSGHQYLVIDRTYRPGHVHGRWALADYVLPESGAWREVLVWPQTVRLKPDTTYDRDTVRLKPDTTYRRTLFIDLETTGLAGGAGTYAFLVGLAWFDGCLFRVRQFFLSSFAAERVLLEAVADLASSSDLVVSYNGKTFDLPLIETRYLFNRLETPFSGLPHLDLLHPARRLWRSDADDEGVDGTAGCRLGVIEQIVCGHARDGDVPGFEIPARYFHYIRTGDARPLEKVLEHNRLDLLSLALLTSHVAQMVEEGAALARTAREAVGLGRLFERAGRLVRARSCFARACGLDDAGVLPGDEAALTDGLRGYAIVCRRERQFGDAAVAWRRLTEMRNCPPNVFREATEALAVHHEHRLRDPRGAQAFAISSLPYQRTPSRTLAIKHRLARLDRKIDMRVPVTAALF
jgi:uncharacterized protein